jgi:hypothetical protein
VLASNFCGSRIRPGILLTVTTTASPVGELETQIVVSIVPCERVLLPSRTCGERGESGHQAEDDRRVFHDSSNFL